MRALYLISRLSGTLLFSREFADDASEDAPESVVTPVRAFTFSPLRHNSGIIGNMSAPQFYWSLYLNMMSAGVYDDTYYVSNDSLTVFASCPHDILAVGVFGLPMAHLSLVVRELQRYDSDDQAVAYPAAHGQVYHANPGVIFDDSITEDEPRREMDDDFLLLEHADDYVFHTISLVRKLGVYFATAFDKTLRKCSTTMKTRFLRFEPVSGTIIKEWFGKHVLRSMALMLHLPLSQTKQWIQPDGAIVPHELPIQLLILTCTTDQPYTNSRAASEPSTARRRSTVQFEAQIAQHQWGYKTPTATKTPRGDIMHSTRSLQQEAEIIYYSTPILTRTRPEDKYSIQRTPRREKRQRKARLSSAKPLEPATRICYRVTAVYSIVGFHDDPEFINDRFYSSVSDLLTDVMSTDCLLSSKMENGSLTLNIKFDVSNYYFVLFWRDMSQTIFAALLRDPPQGEVHFPFWLPFLIPPSNV